MEHRFLTLFVNGKWTGNADRTSKVNEEGSGHIFINDISKLVDLGIKIYKEGDSEDLRFIAYKNASTKKINTVMRQWIYCEGDSEVDIPQFMPGELIICNGGYNVPYYDDQGRRINHNAIFNNQTFKVKASSYVQDGPGGLASIALNLDPMPAMPEGKEIYALDMERSQYAYWDRCNELKRNAREMTGQWPIFYAYKEQWADFDYGYAITSHKSQGRTFRDVIIFENDIIGLKHTKLKNKLQSLYVACTRASRRVYIYNKKYRVDQSELPQSIREELGI